MSISELSAAQETVTIDVMTWPPLERRRLLQSIEMIRVEAEASMNEEPEPSGWSKELLGEVFVMLAAEGAEVQLNVIHHAHNNGGEVSREEVYDIGGYPRDRQLKGFTRPCNRVTQKLRDAGKLPEDEEVELLTPIYSKTARGYSRALGFRIPSGLVNGADESDE